MTQSINRRTLGLNHNPGVNDNAVSGSVPGMVAGLSGRAIAMPTVGRLAPISRRRGAMAAGVGVAALASGALAAPEGAQVVVGNVTFTQQGNYWLISASSGAIINYVSFDILPFETVRFLQPDAMATVLNRINSAAPTRIDGTLLANGQVYFINPAGVTFGANSFVDCNAIYAAAANLSNEDFLAGRNNFTDARGSVVNQGTIHAGTAALIGRHVANYGSISTPQGGAVIMASGKDVLIGEQNGHLFARISGDGAGLAGNAGAAGVENHGSINAGRALMAAGDLYGMAIYNTGTVRAREVNIDGGAKGVVQVGGSIDASNASGKGGSVRIVGEKVGLVGADINASGSTGGGSVTVGRDLASASDQFGAVFIGSDSRISADATVNGNGGDITVFGRDVSRVGGAISARGAGAGLGGNVVTAGSQMVIGANIDTRGGASGAAGRWTIDVRPVQSSIYGPRVSDITITTNPDDPNIGTAPTFDVTSNANTVNISAASIVGQLNANQTVTIQNINSTGVGPNGGRISLLTDLTGITGTGTLDIQAVGGIELQGNINAAGGALNLILTAGASTNIGNGFTLNLGAGTFNSTNTAGSFSLGLGSSIIATGAGASAITANAGNIQLNGDINVGGNFTATANAGFASLNGDLRSTGQFTVNAQSIILSGGILGSGITLSATDDISVDVPLGLEVNAGTGALQILAGTDGTGNLTLGNGGLGDMTLTGASVTLSAGTLLDINTVAVNVVGNTTLIASDFSITSGLAGNGANTLSFRGFGAGAKTFRFSAAGGTADIDILAGALANLSGFTTQTFGLAGDTINLEADLTLSRTTVFAGNVSLLANVTLTGGANDISFGGTLDADAVANNRTFTINTTGATTFIGNVGATEALAAFTTNAGGTTQFGGNVNTVGTLTLADTTTFSGVGAKTLTAGDFAISGSLTGVAGQNLTLLASSGGVLRISAAGGSADVDITQAGLGLITGFDLLTIGQAGDTINIGAGTTTFANALTLAGDTVLVGDAILSGGALDLTFAGTVNGAQSLTVNTTGVTTFSGVVGGGTALTSLSTNAGGSTILTGNVTTTGAQDYNDDVSLAGSITVASTGAGNITFGSLLNADLAANNRSLTINTTGITTFTGAVGGSQTLVNLTTNAGGSTLIGGGMTVSGLLSIGDALSFSGPGTKTLTAGDFTFGGTVTGAAGQSLSLQSFGGANIRISAAGGTADTDITSGSFNNINGFDLITIGTAGQTINLAAAITVFQDAVDFAGDTVLLSNAILSSTAGDQIKFSGTVNADAAANNRTLAVNTVGATIFGSTVGATQALGSLTTNIGGTTTLTGDVTTTGAQTYNDNVILAANVIAASSNNQNITFAGLLNADLAANNRTLTVNTTGTTAFGNVVGGTQALASLTTNAGGTTTIANNITTINAMTFNDAVRFSADATLSSTDATNGGIVFGGNVDASTGGVDLTTVVASGRSVAFNNGALGGGGGQDLQSITTTGGNTSLKGTLSTAGAQSYSGATTVTGITNIVSTGNQAVTFNGTVDSNPADNFSLAVSTGGATTFSGAVGGTGRLSALTVDSGGTVDFAGDVTVLNLLDLSDNVTFTGAGVKTLTAGDFAFGGTVTGVAGQSLLLKGSAAGANTFQISAAGATGDIDILTATLGAINGFDLITIGVTGDTINLNDAAISAQDDLTFAGNVVLLANSALTSTNNDDITFSGTVDGGFDLTVNTTGATVFTGIVGGNAALNSLTTNAGGTTSLGANVTTVNAQTYNDDVLLTANTTLDSTGNADVTFGGLLNGAFDLTVNTTGNTTFTGVVGGNAALNSITTNAGGETRFGANVTTVNAQTYNDNVALLANTTIASTSAGNVTFGGTVNGAFDLTVNTTGNTVFTGIVGGGAALTSLTTNAGGTTTLTNNVTTTGAQSYGDSVTLAGNVTTASTGAGNITFGGGATGAFDLTINTTGITSFGGTVSVNSITTDAGGTTQLSATISTVANQTYNDAVLLTGNTTTTSTGAGAITFAGALNGGFDLVVNTSGVTTFNAVGQGSALRNLTTGVGGSTVAKGNISVSESLNLLDAALVENTITFGAQTIFFGSTLDSNAGFANLTLNATGTAAFDLIPVRFGGDIGMGTALGSLIINATTSNAGYATVVFSDQFALTGGTTYSIAGITPGKTFTVKTNGGDIDFGDGHRVLSFGTLNLDAGAGTATFGDLTSLGDINVTAGAIRIRLRQGGQLFSNSGSAGTDLGTDLVAFGNITFSTTASFIGSGTGATYTNGSGSPASNLNNLTFRAFDGVLSTNLVNNQLGGGSPFLNVDLKSDGPTDTDVSTLLAGATPRLSGEGSLAPNTRITKALAQDLKDIIPIPLVDADIQDLIEYLLGRAVYTDLPQRSAASTDDLPNSNDYRITTSRISSEFALEVVQSWRELMRGTDEQGNQVNKADEMKDILDHAWTTFKDQAPESEQTPANFRAFVEGKAGLEEARDLMNRVESFFGQLDQLGLTPFETDAAKNHSVLRLVTPPSMKASFLLDAISPKMPPAPQAVREHDEAVALR